MDFKVNRRQLIAAGGVSVFAGCTGAIESLSTSSGDEIEEEVVFEDIRYPYTSPVVESESVVFSSSNVGVVSLDAVSSEVNWRKQVRGDPIGTPSTNGDLVVGAFTSENESNRVRIVALDFRSGDRKWVQEIDAKASFSPRITDELVFVRSSGTIHAINANDGTFEWSKTDLPSINSIGRDIGMNIRPTVWKDTLFVPNPNRIVARSISNGRKIWEEPIDDIRASPTVHNETVYVTGTSSGVVALNARTGDSVWRRELSGCWTSPFVTGESVYTTAGFDVIVLDTETGNELWRTAGHGLHGDIYSSPIKVGSEIITGSIKRTATAVEATGKNAGRINWSIEGGTRMSPTAYDDTIYITNEVGLHKIGES